MKSDLYFLAKAALVLTVVDAFIPRAETYAKKHAKTTDDGAPQFNHEKQTFHPHPPHYPQHYPYSTEINMGIFDLNPFHGGGSGASKQALDEQWEIQQAILRERRGHTDKGHFSKPKSSIQKNIEIVGAKKFEKLDVDDHTDEEHGHKKSLSEIFFGVKKFERD